MSDFPENCTPVSKLNDLIHLLNNHTPFTRADLAHLREKDKVRMRVATERMIEEGITLGQAIGTHDFLNQDEDNFRAYLKSIDNLLEQHVAIVQKDFELYLN